MHSLRSILQNRALTLAIACASLAGVSFAQQSGSVKPAVGPTRSQPVAAPEPKPVLSYATYLLNPADRVNAVAVGNDGTMYVAGVTLSRPAAVQETKRTAGDGNAFVARLSADGSKLLYFTYLDNSGLAGVTRKRWIGCCPCFAIKASCRRQSRTIPVPRSPTSFTAIYCRNSDGRHQRPRTTGLSLISS